MRNISFRLNDFETQRANDFQNEHLCSCSAQAFHFIITPTGIGNNVQVECSKCKAKKDVTDCNCW